ncbi:mechanosensitive ion channel domain-containing protein-like (ISS) [Dorcoceras hygrometricum]|uniref:Mechanosensitive ion channel domain-containing protein-like (ISS) n=1 Tax=Dorcoceras hygrometricum TaxID=472368 RepID=A0A2Z7CTS8_9LAMI|nr:mechanosensitive ion channel domain-containing protein-like (ISS) [Dorcoceras hygrometricum]
MPTLTCSCDQQPLRATVLPAPATTTGFLQPGPPPGPDGSNVTNLGSNRGLTKDNWSLQVDAPAMLCRRDHLLVFTFVLHTPATNSVALQAGPPPYPDGPNVTDLTSNHGPTRENEPLQVDAPALWRDAPLTTSTARCGSLEPLATILPSSRQP